MLHRLVSGRGVCNIGRAVTVAGELQWWPLQQALNHLLRRHPALRGVVRMDGTVPRKRLRPADEPFPLHIETATEAELPAVLSRVVGQPFDLDDGLLVRAHLIRMPDATGLCLVLHHLVADLYTAAMLMREAARLYDGIARDGEPPPDLSGVVAPYLEPAPSEESIAYWLRHLDGFDPTRGALSGARPIEGRPTFAGGSVYHLLSDAAMAALGQLQQRTRITRNIVLLAAYALLLYRHGAGTDLVIGVPVVGRPDTVAAAGFHNSTLPVRVRLDPDAGLLDLIRAVAGALLEGMTHADASFEAVQAALAGRSGDWRVPVFRHAYNYRDDGLVPGVLAAGSEPETLAGRPMRWVEVRNLVSRLDLELVAMPWTGGVTIEAVFSTEVHDHAFVETLLARYDAILCELADRPDGPVGDVTGWTPADRRAVAMLESTDRTAIAPAVLTQVRDQGLADPDAVALRVDGHGTSYGRLLAAADAIRRRLVEAGVRPGEPVALAAARGVELAAATLGVWAAGATYLPLDPAHPAARLVAQLDDAGVRVILADGPPAAACLSGRDWLALPDLCRDPDAPRLADWPAPQPADCAYVIYTSGSTGTPKGVEISHGSLANVVADFARRLAVRPGGSALWLTTFSFDISALELFLPLTTGGAVVVAPDSDRVDPDRLLRLIAREDVAVVQATPTTWRHLAPAVESQLAGRQLLCGGEPLDAALAGRLLAAGGRPSNVYGPTETTIWSTATELTAPVTDPVPLGRPVAGTRLSVRDAHGRPVPPGVSGELCIGGAGVALGYRGRPRLTRERFRDGWYHTGDEVCLTGRGLIFLGRLDRQVKVRGHRLELTEIESTLYGHPGVREAAVLTEPDRAGHLRLVAVVSPTAAPVEPGQLRAYLSGRLPPAAVPSRFVTVATFPRTGNGKVDHRALGALIRDRPDGTGGVAGAVAVNGLPDEPVLRRLVILWRDILGDRTLGPDDDFFVNGGHSLLAVELVDRAGAEFGRALGFEAVFGAPTPRRFADLLERSP
ncbi:MAG: hypothetical protein V7603_1496 [Micromonosporaceae bacterium]